MKLLDFGLARSTRGEANLTQSGLIVGTPAYMAPEQARGGPVDSHCDLFSLGTVLYQACTGRAPFAGTDTIATLMDVTTAQPPPPGTVAPEVPPALSDLIMALLAKDPADRPAGAAEVARRLAAIEASSFAENRRDGSHPGAAKPAPADSPGRKRRRRRAVVALLAGTALAAATLMYVQTDRGTLEIRTFDDSVKVSVEQGGAVVGILDPRSKQQLTIRSGKYRLQIVGADNAGLELVTDQGAAGAVTLTRGGKVVAEVRRQKPVDPAAEAAGPLEKAWMKTVQALPPDRQVEEVRAELRRRNPGFDGKLTHQTNAGAVSELTFCSGQVADISPVRALKHLERLSCKGSCREKRKLADLSPLQGMALKYLNADATRVADLSALRGMPLVELYLADTDVSDLSPLRRMPLRFLTVGRCQRVSDLSPLCGLPLANLEIFGTSVRDLAPLRGMPLRFVMVMDTPVTDWGPLKGLPLEMIDGEPAAKWWRPKHAK